MQHSFNNIYTFQFGLLCTSSFLFFASFSMILPELPAYLTDMGGGKYIGFIISLFTLAALISRPFSGKLADTIGRRPIIYFGVITSFICSLLYPVLTGVSGFLLLRFLHGFSTGFTPTGTSAYVADIIPANRRGEAMGILGLTSNIGTAIGPALGSEITVASSINLMFYTASGFAILSMLILLGLKETLVERQAFRFELLKIKSNEIIEPRVTDAAIAMFLMVIPLGVVLTVVPDLSEHLNMRNKGVFFTFYTVSSLLIRFLAGKISDKLGRVIVIKWGAVVLIIAMIYMGYAPTAEHLLAAAVIYGIAVGLASPTIFAWTIDLAHKDKLGKAMATVYIALEAGIGLAAVCAGWLYAKDIHRIPMTFFLPAFAALIAFIYLQFGIKRRKVKKTYS